MAWAKSDQSSRRDCASHVRAMTLTCFARCTCDLGNQFFVKLELAPCNVLHYHHMTLLHRQHSCLSCSCSCPVVQLRLGTSPRLDSSGAMLHVLCQVPSAKQRTVHCRCRWCWDAGSLSLGLGHCLVYIFLKVIMPNSISNLHFAPNFQLPIYMVYSSLFNFKLWI
jgi:hypothetical protein